MKEMKDDDGGEDGGENFRVRVFFCREREEGERGTVAAGILVFLDFFALFLDLI